MSWKDERIAGDLLFGIPYNGKDHRKFEMRPETVKDLLELEGDEFAQKDEKRFALALIAKITRFDGILDALDGKYLMENLRLEDLNILHETKIKLDERIKKFCPQRPQSEAGSAAISALGDKP